MSTPATSTCKRLLLRRCLSAVLLSVAVQYLLLTVFLLFVNFQLLHPISWVTNTFSLVCSFYTWFGSIPLIVAVCLYGILLSHEHLRQRRYCPTRYRWLLENWTRKVCFLGAHLLVGYLTVWLYTGYLSTDYRHLIFKCYSQDCLSSYHVFLLGMGIVAGCNYFVSEYMRKDASIEFPIVDQWPSEQVRELLCSTLMDAPFKALMPTLTYTLVFSLCGSLVKYRLSHLFGVDADDRLLGLFDVVSNVKLLFYAWLLTAQILSNMHLMRRFYSVLLAEDLTLVVARNRLAFPNEKEITIVSALGLSNVYAVQCLAAHFLYKASRHTTLPVRKEIFQLTEPGNRPANWRALCDQCLSSINSFTDELTESVRKNSSINKTDNKFETTHSDNQARPLAEKVLLREYNQRHGIRPVISPVREVSTNQRNAQSNDIIHHVNRCERKSMQQDDPLKRFVQSIPGIVYFFAEPEGAKTVFLLENSLPLVWITQGLAHICVSSLKEDRFGVVQNDLPAIFKSLYRLRSVLDKIHNGTITLRIRTISFNVLRCAVRRSLYNICNSFYDYLGELTSTAEELRQLQSVVKR